jgi:hypothetical protein
MTKDIRFVILIHDPLSVDTTFSTNKDKRPLLIESGKDNNRRNFSVFLCFLPSEQRWVFKFSFGHVIPSLLVKKLLEEFNKSILTETQQYVVIK